MVRARSRPAFMRLLYCTAHLSDVDMGHGAGETDAPVHVEACATRAMCCSASPTTPALPACSSTPPPSHDPLKTIADPRGITGDIAHRARPSGADLLAADAVLAGQRRPRQAPEFVLQAPRSSFRSPAGRPKPADRGPPARALRGRAASRCC